MSVRTRSALLLSLLAVGLCGCSSMKDKDKVIITVHSQGNDMDSPKTIFRQPIGNQEMIFKVIPEFSTESVVGVHPFPAEDGTYGVALKLDFKGTNALDLVTRMRRGEILMSMVNGTVVDTVRIDKPVSDGIFTIWRGLPENLVAELQKKFAPISSVKSSSEFLDMTPSTEKEKEQAKKRAEREAKEKAKKEKEAARRRARGEFEPEPPTGELVPLGDLLNNP